MGLRVLEACDELWLCGNRMSDGMKAELAAAEQLGVPEIPMEAPGQTVTATDPVMAPAM